jgi:monovalent cation:H+ antiporter-2, CPA2 family
MHGISFIQDLAVVMIVAALVTVLFHRLKQPVVLGYLIAGVIVGPNTPPFPLIRDEQSIKTLAELGVVFLMFNLGLHFSLRKLKQVGATALITAPFEILLMIWIGYQVGRLFGWSSIDSVFLGAIISISSSTILVKTLHDLGRTREKFASLVFGILVIEDILAIAMIALLSGIAMTGSLNAVEVVKTIGQLVVFLTAVLVVGLIAVPRLLHQVDKFKSNEMLLITVLGLCFGVSLLAVKFGYSVALGAFIIGAIVAEARESGKVVTLIEPVRDLFSAVFFVAIGMLIDPHLLVKYAVPILVISLALVVGKVTACSFGIYISGNDTRTSLRAGMSLAQIGEFSFIIASLGLALNVTSEFLYPIAVSVSALTSFMTPHLITASDRLEAWFDRVGPRPLTSYLDVYTLWVAKLKLKRDEELAWKLVRKWTFQMLLNIALITAIFLAAIYTAKRIPIWSVEITWLPKATSTIWLIAALIALPMLIATLRKLQALGMLLADVATHRSVASDRIDILRKTIANTILFAGTIGVVLWILFVSAALLPAWPVLLASVIIVGLVTILLWRSLIKVYSKAQIALQETFAEPSVEETESSQHLSTILHGAELQLVNISQTSPAVKKLIRELELRSRTGATVVGIERTTQNIINPGPDEELQVGDKILLLGRREQLDSAREMLAAH